jgi:exodeoxyribonuclease VII large subunit
MTGQLSLNNLPTTDTDSQQHILSVEDLNRQIRQMIEGQLSLVWVKGEISNFKPHSSGHFYFSLKDPKSQINAVMFRGYNSRLKFKPKDGMEVIVRGRVTVYEPRGNYQITCELMEPVGAGALQKAFEQLKEKLKNEGLFEASRKRSLPSFPKHVAIVTSPTGAAIQDILNILSRRNKTVKITLVPTIVQGESAAPSIVEALDKAYRLSDVDAIIVGRGGGSVEDLWCFNDEAVARKIASSPVPIISAVGHEIDFTISDFVADLRAPTPSAAAELVVKNSEDLINKLSSLERMLKFTIQKFITNEKNKIQYFSKRLIDPKRKLQDLLQRRDELSIRLQQSLQNQLNKKSLLLKALMDSLITPDQIIQQKKSKVDLNNLKIKNKIIFLLDQLKYKNQKNMALLDSLSPLRVVERGYSVTMKNAELIKSSSQVEIGDLIQIKLMQGNLTAEVKEKG